MTTVLCKKCNIVKEISEFYAKYQVNGYQCKLCAREYARKNRKENPDKIRATNNAYNNRNREKVRELNRNHIKNNGDRVRERARINQKKYMKDPQFRIMKSTRTRIWHFLIRNSQKKNTKTGELLGCDSQFLKDWLEYQFNSHMSWDNYGEYWHIDHVVPCESFDARDIEDLKRCFNWKNLRPLEGSENISKRAKIITKDILNQEIKVYYYTIKLQLPLVISNNIEEHG